MHYFRSLCSGCCKVHLINGRTQIQPHILTRNIQQWIGGMSILHRTLCVLRGHEVKIYNSQIIPFATIVKCKLSGRLPPHPFSAHSFPGCILKRMCSSTPEQIRLIDENGKNLGIIGFSDAKKQAAERELSLKLVGKPNNSDTVPTYRFMDVTDDKKKNRPEENNKLAKPKFKEVTMNSGIGDHDLSWKTKLIVRFLDENLRVRITISKRAKATVTAEQMMQKVVEKVSDKAVVDGGIKTLPRGIAFYLRPLKK